MSKERIEGLIETVAPDIKLKKEIAEEIAELRQSIKELLKNVERLTLIVETLNEEVKELEKRIEKLENRPQKIVIESPPYRPTPYEKWTAKWKVAVK